MFLDEDRTLRYKNKIKSVFLAKKNTCDEIWDTGREATKVWPGQVLKKNSFVGRT